MVVRLFFGFILFIAGLLKLACMWNLVQMDWLWSQPWTEYILPFALVYIGCGLMMGGVTHDREQWLQRPVPSSEEGKRITCVVRYGGDEYVYRGETFHGASLDAMCGGIRLDLREASITEDEEIDIRTCCGGVELFVPPTVNVIVQSRSFIGGVGNQTARVVGQNVPTLHVVASNFIGGVDIKN